MHVTLIEDNLRLANYVANKLYIKNCGIEFNDISQVCNLGLVKAARTFDENKGFKFSTYAYKVMENEVLNYLRKEKKQGFIRNKTISLDTTISKNNEGTKLTLIDVLGEDDISFELMELLEVIKNVLTDREKYILLENLYYKKEQDELAKELGLSQAQVSRIKNAALSKLRKALQLVEAR